MKTRDRGAGFVLPALILLSLVTVYPVLAVTYLSLLRKLPLFGISKFAGLDNYAFLVRDERFWNALWNTLYFTLASVTFELLLGLVIALLLNRKFAMKGIMTAIVLVPWAVPTVVSARMWEWIYNTDYGILNYLLGTNVNWLGSPLWAINAAVFMDVWKTTPFAAILFLAGLRVIPRELYNAARVDGAGEWAIFRWITLPLLMPVALVVLIFRVLDAFRVFDAIYVLTGGGPANTTETLSIYAYKVLFQTLQFGYGSTLSIVVFLCIGAISVLSIRILGRRQRLKAEPSAEGSRGFRREDRKGITMKRVACSFGLIAAALWSLGPFLWQVITSVKPEAELTLLPPILPAAPTLGHYTAVFSGTPFLRIIANSTIVASSSTALSVAVAAPAAFALAKMTVPFKRVVLFLILSASMFPPIATVSPLFLIITRLGLRDTWWALIITYTTFTLPLSTWIMTVFSGRYPTRFTLRRA